jgi:hypothetical protein
MDQDRSYHGKRRYDDFNDGYTRNRDQDLRHKLDREQEEHC